MLITLLVGWCYSHGRGYAQDKKKASELFDCAAAAGYPRAMWRKALCYATGSEVTQDDQSAQDWFERAADKGLADAQFALGKVNPTQCFLRFLKLYSQTLCSM